MRNVGTKCIDAAGPSLINGTVLVHWYTTQVTFMHRARAEHWLRLHFTPHLGVDVLALDVKREQRRHGYGSVISHTCVARYQHAGLRGIFQSGHKNTHNSGRTLGWMYLR